MKIAQFKRLSPPPLDYVIIRPESDAPFLKDHIRISEYIEVDFPPLSEDSIVDGQLTAIDDAEKELRVKFQAALSMLENQRSQLRAIPLKR